MTLSVEDLKLMKIDPDSKKESKTTKFIVYIDQTHYGCDYTIACGKVLYKLDAQSYEQAIEELKTKVLGEFSEEYGYDRDDCYWYEDLESIDLYEIKNAYQIPLEEWYAEREEVEKRLASTQDKEQRRRQYEALKAEFE